MSIITLTKLQLQWYVIAFKTYNYNYFSGLSLITIELQLQLL